MLILCQALWVPSAKGFKVYEREFLLSTNSIQGWRKAPLRATVEETLII